MPNLSPNRVRFLLLGVLSVLAVGFAQSQGQAQFGRPPVPPGRPPIGFNGGINGMPGRPGGITGISGMGLHGGIGGMGSRMEWRCSRCNGLLANGAVMTCPHCGARLVGVTFEHGGITGISGRPNIPNMASGPGPMPFSSPPPINTNPTFPASTNNRPNEMPPLTPNPNAGRGGSASEPSTSSTSSENDSSTSSTSSDSGSSGRTGKIIALVVATVFFLVIVAMLIVVVSKSSGRKPVRHRRRRPLSLDDDDDDD